LFTAGAITLGSAVSHVRPPQDSLLGPLLFVGSADEARRLLLTCATSIVGVLALIIGLTMVAVQTAANRYSPRLLRNFVRDGANQAVLAVFVGSFTYNAAGLYTVGLTPGDFPRLSVTLGLCTLFLCIGALIYYIDRMVHLIQIDRVLATLRITTGRVIADSPPGVGRCAGQGDAAVSAGPPPGSVELRANTSGFIQFVHTESIVAAASRCGCTCLLASGVGAHVIVGTPIAWVWPENTSLDTNLAPIIAALDDAVHIGFERTRRQDVELGFAQLVDVAARCMHDFDFHTAVQAAHEMAILMCQLAPLPLGAEIYRDGAGADRLIIPAQGFDHYLDLACGQLQRLGASDPETLSALLNMLRDIGPIVTSEDRRSSVLRKLDEVLAAGQRRLQSPVEIAKLEAAADNVKQRIVGPDRFPTTYTQS
jgi:uncharacterized membrane protein